MIDNTIAMVVRWTDGEPSLLQVISDEQEVQFIEAVFHAENSHVLEELFQFRELKDREDEEFADFVEDLVSQPSSKMDSRQQGLNWLKSKMKIEQYSKAENEAAEVIAQFALNVFKVDPKKNDFWLAGPRSKIRIRIYEMNGNSQKNLAA